MSKQQVIAQMLRAGRRDLANVLAYQATATLIIPPRNLTVFVNNLVKRLRGIVALSKRVEDRFNNLDKMHRAKDGMEYNPVEDFKLLDASGYGSYGIGDFRYLFEKLGGTDYDSFISRAEDIERDFKYLKQEDAPARQLEWVGRVASSMDYLAERMHDAATEPFDNPKWPRESFKRYQEYGYTPDEFPDAIKLKDLLDVDRIAREYRALKRDLKDAAVRLNHMKAAAWQQYNDPKWMPESEDTEPLYHASVDAKTIFRRKAFETKVPEVKGLGGAQGDKRGRPAISFTSDLYVAKEIARTLKEAIMIARGEVTATDVLDWSRRHGIYNDVDRAFKSNHGQLDPKKTHHVMNLYRLFLTFHKTRYNPLFFGDMAELMRRFKKQKTSDVGVLVCQVDMRNKDIAYLSSMHEYRVPPEAVVSVDKLIR